MTWKILRVAAILAVGLGVIGGAAQAQQTPSEATAQRRALRRSTTIGAKPNAATAEAAQNVGQSPVSPVAMDPKNLSNNPLRAAVYNVIQKAKQEAGLEAAAMPNATATQNAAQSATAGAMPSAAQLAAKNNLTADTAPSAPQGTTPNAEANQHSQVRRAGITVPAEFQAGLADLQNAQNSLLTAGLKWGGHKAKASGFINQALTACEQPTIPLREAAVAATEQSAAMQNSFTQLTNAINVFKSSTDTWEGRRDQAVTLMQQALSEIQAGIDFAKNHNNF